MLYVTAEQVPNGTGVGDLAAATYGRGKEMNLVSICGPANVLGPSCEADDSARSARRAHSATPEKPVLGSTDLGWTAAADAGREGAIPMTNGGIRSARVLGGDRRGGGIGPCHGLTRSRFRPLTRAGCGAGSACTSSAARIGGVPSRGSFRRPTCTQGRTPQLRHETEMQPSISPKPSSTELSSTSACSWARQEKHEPVDPPAAGDQHGARVRRRRDATFMDLDNKLHSFVRDI